MNLSGCGLVDEDLAILRNASILVRLDVSDNPISDAGIDHLIEVVGLREVDLRGTKVTHTGAQLLEQALPNCVIIRD